MLWGIGQFYLLYFENKQLALVVYIQFFGQLSTIHEYTVQTLWFRNFHGQSPDCKLTET